MLPLHYTPMRRAENTIPIPFRTYHLAGVGVTFTLYSPFVGQAGIEPTMWEVTAPVSPKNLSLCGELR